MNTLAPPPVSVAPPGGDRWLKLSIAAQRLGVSPAILQSEIETGRSGVRVCRLGKRELLHVAEVDLERFRHRLGASSPAAQPLMGVR